MCVFNICVRCSVATRNFMCAAKNYYLKTKLNSLTNGKMKWKQFCFYVAPVKWINEKFSFKRKWHNCSLSALKVVPARFFPLRYVFVCYVKFVYASIGGLIDARKGNCGFAGIMKWCLRHENVTTIFFTFHIQITTVRTSLALFLRFAFVGCTYLILNAEKEIVQESDGQSARYERIILVFQQIHVRRTNEHTCWFSIFIFLSLR